MAVTKLVSNTELPCTVNFAATVIMATGGHGSRLEYFCKLFLTVIVVAVTCIPGYLPFNDLINKKTQRADPDLAALLSKIQLSVADPGYGPEGLGPPPSFLTMYIRFIVCVTYTLHNMRIR